MLKIAGIAVLICVSIGGSPAHGITVRVFDQVGASKQMLQQAEQEASLVLEHSGDLEIEWLNCRAFVEACARELRGDELVLMLKDAPGAKYGEGGRALLGPTHAGIYAHIYYHSVLREAGFGNIEPDCLLGYVIAHEIGHLLGLQHSRGGVMIARWKAPELQLMSMACLRFDKTEYRRMRAEATTRLSNIEAGGHRHQPETEAVRAADKFEWSTFFACC